MEKVRDHPLYKEALQAFVSGNQKKGMELLNQLHQEPEIKTDIESHINSDESKEVLKNSPFTLIDKG